MLCAAARPGQQPILMEHGNAHVPSAAACAGWPGLGQGVLCQGDEGEANSPLLCDPCEGFPCSRKQMGQWAIILSYSPQHTTQLPTSRCALPRPSWGLREQHSSKPGDRRLCGTESHFFPGQAMCRSWGWGWRGVGCTHITPRWFCCVSPGKAPAHWSFPHLSHSCFVGLRGNEGGARLAHTPLWQRGE